ncbi:MAG TPA: sulfite exporter TauE/SafE family protein [Vicinamibacterales bacterium]|nr:sulfite exporter TauE/SafE family protein [Vicinamibacterales bacterium]
MRSVAFDGLGCVSIAPRGGEGTNASRSRALRAALTGIAGGVFSGLTGVGGGAVMVPLLTGQLGLSQHRAPGTSLAIILLVAVAGVVAYGRAGNIDWPLVLALTPGALVGVYLGARAMVKVPALQLRFLFGLFLLFVAFRQLVWHVSAHAPQHDVARYAIDAGVGFAGGALAGVLGVGGGAIFVPAIAIFGLAGVAAGEDPQKVAQGVSLVVIVATALLGTVTNARQAVVASDVLLWAVPAAVAAAFTAAAVANRLDAEVLKRIYGVTAALLAAPTLYTSLRGMWTHERVDAVELGVS